MYRIDQFSKITHINKLLLRTWEKRYTFLVPHRTSTNIRYYDDSMIVKALNIKLLINNGVKVSNISKMSNDEIVSHVHNIEINNSHNTFVDVNISKIIEFSLTFDKDKLSELYENGISKKGVINYYRDIIIPTLQRVGILWLGDMMSHAQEHFLSSFLKQKLNYSIELIDNCNSTKDKWILFLPENELHEISLLISKLILLTKGFDVLYLGPNLPFDSLKNIDSKFFKSNLLFFCISNESLSKINDKLDILNKNFPESKVHLILSKNNKKLIENKYFLKTFSEIDTFSKYLDNF